ncbi:transcriptional repressor [hydrocarbon metagenome]|uniref:Transcriptional repressor n=1 Tax=hydrocarbon metagenome TaxID=938273 RepID=A0A0W8FLN3_9ZZZZ
MKNLFNVEDVERKGLLILRILSESQDPLGARIIASRMKDSGLDLSERTVRYHLKLMDHKGLTRLIGRRDGRIITDHGKNELSNARVQDKVGLCSSRIDMLAFKTTFDLSKQQGMVPVNISLFTKDRFEEALKAMNPAFQNKIVVSDRIAVAQNGEKLGDVTVPDGKIGLATVCSILINGILLKNGVPIDSKFGGILQVKNGVPLRFVELIHYAGSSLDPSEIFIRGKMTSVNQVVEKGEGNILANFREIPAVSMAHVMDLIEGIQAIGLGGILTVGGIGNTICETIVGVNKAGMILIGGLNPVACAHEQGIDVDNLAMTTIMEFRDMHHISDM